MYSFNLNRSNFYKQSLNRFEGKPEKPHFTLNELVYNGKDIGLFPQYFIEKVSGNNNEKIIDYNK